MSSGDPKQDIRAFWEANPLMTGEFASDAGTWEFFEAHERIYTEDVFHRGRIPEYFFPFPSGATVLDVGCGPGIWTRALARRGYRAIGMDLTGAGVRIARDGLALYGLEGSLVQGDAEHLPFPDGSLDGIVSHGVIHHTPDTEGCLREMGRVLRPGGIAVVSVYYRNVILRSRVLTRVVSSLLGARVSLPGRRRQDLLAGGDPDEIVRRYDGGDNPLGKAYTAEEFARMVRAGGLRIQRTGRFYFPLRAFGRLGGFVKPLHGILSARFGLMYVVVARKPPGAG